MKMRQTKKMKMKTTQKMINNKGLSLIEIVVAIGIMAMIGGLVIVSMSVVPSTRGKQVIETFRSNYMLVRDYAQTHTGAEETYIELKYDTDPLTEDGEQNEHYRQIVMITKTGKKAEKEYFPADSNIYYGCGLFDLADPMDEFSEIERLFGQDDAPMVENNGYPRLKFKFNQEGRVTGPVFLNWIAVKYKEKVQKLMFTAEGVLMDDYEYYNALKKTDNGAGIFEKKLAADWAYENGGSTSSSARIVAVPECLYHDNVVKYRAYNGKPLNQQPNILYDHDMMTISGVYRAAGDPTKKVTYEMYFTLKKDEYLNVKWPQPDQTDQMHYEKYPYLSLKEPGSDVMVLTWVIDPNKPDRNEDNEWQEDIVIPERN